eukprot:2770737-Prymnesium_polylepis.3
MPSTAGCMLPSGPRSARPGPIIESSVVFITAISCRARRAQSRGAVDTAVPGLRQLPPLIASMATSARGSDGACAAWLRGGRGRRRAPHLEAHRGGGDDEVEQLEDVVRLVRDGHLSRGGIAASRRSTGMRRDVAHSSAAGKATRGPSAWAAEARISLQELPTVPKRCTACLRKARVGESGEQRGLCTHRQTVLRLRSTRTRHALTQGVQLGRCRSVCARSRRASRRELT